MSLEVLTQGGGAGGEAASIFVTGLSESDTVSAVKHSSVLPSGYTPVVYIESSGTQCIDTGFKPNNNTKVVMDVQMTKEVNQSFYFGTRTTPPLKGFYVGYVNGYSRVCYGSVDCYGTSIQLSSPTERITVTQDKNVTTISNVGSYTSSQQTFQCEHNLALLAFVDGGNFSNLMCAKLYSCQIYDNGTLVRDFVPCKNASGEVGLYDKANDVFYGNAGTGEFVAGPVDGKTVQGKWVAKTNPAFVVPEGFTHLEYIESTGTQYIDTGFKPNSNTSIEMRVLLPTSQSGKQTRFFETRNSQDTVSGSFGFISFNDSNNLLQFRYNDSAAIKEPLAIDKVYDIKTDKNKLFVNDELKITHAAVSFQVNYNLFLFGFNTPSGVTNSSGVYRLCYFNLYDNGTLVRSFIPAKRSSDSVLGLYDIVNGVFYTNAGTGTFVAGAEIPSTIDGHIISPIKEYGMWTVTATNGEDTTTQDVLVDAAVEYEIGMGYGYYTEFDEKEDGWIEEGGTFSYGDGLYVADNSAKGTVPEGNDVYKYLTIPLRNRQKFTLEFDTLVKTSTNNRIGVIRVNLLSDTNETIVYVRHTDSWGATMEVLFDSFCGSNNIYSLAKSTSLNGVTLNHKFIYDGTTLKYYLDGVERYSGAHSLSAGSKVKIDFGAYGVSSYPLAYMKVGYLEYKGV